MGWGAKTAVISPHRQPGVPRLRYAAAIVALDLMLSGCNDPKSLVAPNTLGPTIVSLNPCSDAILSKVTRPGQLLGVSHYSHDPAASSMGVDAAKQYASISGSVEEIAMLAPDIVVADIFLSPATAQAIRDLGIKLITIGNVDSISESLEQVHKLADVAENPVLGEKLIDDISQSVRSAEDGLSKADIPVIVWQSGGIVAGDKSLIAELLRKSGFKNAAATRGLRQADYLPLEAILMDPPKLILAAGDQVSQEDRLLSHPALSSLKDTWRVPFDSTMLWCGGPTIVKAIGELTKLRRELDRPSDAVSS